MRKELSLIIRYISSDGLSKDEEVKVVPCFPSRCRVCMYPLRPNYDFSSGPEFFSRRYDHYDTLTEKKGKKLYRVFVYREVPR